MKPFQPEAVQSDPYIGALALRLEDLAIEIMEYQDGDYRDGLLAKWWAQLQGPGAPRGPVWDSAWRKYQAECDRARQSYPRWPEYMALVQEYEDATRLGPPQCWECTVERGQMAWTTANVQGFMARHGARARACLSHSVELRAARGQPRRRTAA